jgi:hypothetical protein
LQEKVHADLARLGHSVHVTYSKEDIDRVLGTA